MMDFFVCGTPIAQPRVRARVQGKHARVYNPSTADNWKQAVVYIASMYPEWGGGPKPIHVRLLFIMPRPTAHYRSNGTLTPKAPRHHIKKPDVDNLAKAVLDALVTSKRIPDDCCIDALEVRKRYAEVGEVAGCKVEIE